MLVNKRVWRTVTIPMLVCALLLAHVLPVQAGDPRRYADKVEFPDRAVEYFPGSGPGETPINGELVDAIRFELIRGYPVEPQDSMQDEDREFRPYREMTRAEFAAVLSRSLQEFCERQFLVKRGEKWLIAAADPELQVD